MSPVSFLLYHSSLSSTFPYVDTVSLSLSQEGLRFLGSSLVLGIFSGLVGAPPFFELRMWEIPFAVGPEVGQILIECKNTVLQLERLVAVVRESRDANLPILQELSGQTVKAGMGYSGRFYI